MTLFEYLALALVVYVGIAVFVFGVVGHDARTRREVEYAIRIGLCWPCLFWRLE